ncbi:monocarboxylate transporter 12-like [Zophobas morio]|uniref:monocarboxylate transporter 12-like n=1 Tax=Zophobas morio TaxID=2755281 RepID=UPI003082711F
MTISSTPQPDGGYGWVIVFASALTNFITLSLIQCFGLILKDTFTELHLSAMEGALIINLNGAFGMLTGPITGVLQKVYGCRITAFGAALLLTTGMVLTSFSRSFLAIVGSYGIVTSLGMQMSESTQRLAINLYFKKKRSLVTGFVMTVAGFGPILIPQLIGILLKVYSTEEVILLYGGMCAHIFVAAALLQPVEWHVEGKGTREEKIELKELGKTVARIFDLDLLKDPVFDNILAGLALASFAELNFTLLIPFILHDYDLTTDQIATFLSTLGVADMISRFLSPYVGNYFKKPSRLMFAYSLVILMIIKFTIILFDNYYVLLIIGFTLGMAKGIRKVYMWLVIPDYVSLEKLPSAAGMDMLARGCCILIGGPILGVLRDATGSYTICIIVMNCITITTILMWATEAIIKRFKRRNLEFESEVEGMSSGK